MLTLDLNLMRETMLTSCTAELPQLMSMDQRGRPPGFALVHDVPATAGIDATSR
ncbi:MAG: hypothetical protein AAYR33_07590 [Acetobacteraceae bacterium]